jgi:hypothetical protein
MKINQLTKEVIERAASERIQAENLFKQKNQELITLLIATTGEQGFNGYEIKEDELILKFPKEDFKESVNKLRKKK